MIFKQIPRIENVDGQKQISSLSNENITASASHAYKYIITFSQCYVQCWAEK